LEIAEMVIAKLCGGLGNQLFQYATGRAVAIRTGAGLYLDRNDFDATNYRRFELEAFRLGCRVLPPRVAQFFDGKPGRSIFKRVGKHAASLRLNRLIDRCEGYDPRIEQTGGHVWLGGFWQCERYFTGVRERLLDELSPRPEIAVQVRRGDLVTDPVYSRTFGTLGREYYSKAIELVAAGLPNAHLFVFTEDRIWAEQNIPPIRPMTIVSGSLTRSDVQDFIVMTHCRHFVIANSTFGWWGAWLSRHEDKRVVAPARFYREPRAWEKDLVPTKWLKVDAELIGPG
jgi:Glycosyl transferase family 11